MIIEKHISNTKSIGLRSKRNMPHFKNQSTKECYISKMTGRIYKEGREIRGGQTVWTDTVGEPDNRIQVYASFVTNFQVGGYDLFHKVFKDMEEVNEHFEIIES